MEIKYLGLGVGLITCSWIRQWGKEEEGIKDDLDLGVEQLVMQQLGRCGEEPVYSRKSAVPFGIHILALESNQPGSDPDSAPYLDGWPSLGLSMCHCKTVFLSQNFGES